MGTLSLYVDAVLVAVSKSSNAFASWQGGDPGGFGNCLSSFPTGHNCDNTYWPFGSTGDISIWLYSSSEMSLGRDSVSLRLTTATEYIDIYLYAYVTGNSI